MLLIFILLYVLWVIGPEWNALKLLPKWYRDKENKHKINKTY